MTTLAGARETTRTRGVALTQDAVAIASVAVWTLVLVVATWGTWGDLDSDTGYDLLAATRLADGSVPYLDFTYYYGPLGPALAAVAVLVGGHGIGVGVAFGLVVTLLLVAATYAVGRIVLPPLGAGLAAGLTAAVALAPNNYGFVLPHTYDAPLGTLLLLGLCLAAWRYASTNAQRWLVVGGVVVGLTALTKPEPFAAAVVASVVWLVVRSREGARLRREALLVGAPAALVAALVYGPLLAASSFQRLVFENLYPVDLLQAGDGAMTKARMPMTLGSVAEVGGRLVVYALGAAVLVGLGRLLHLRLGGRVLVAGVALGALLVAAVALVKPDGLRDLLYYVYGWIPAGALIALVVVLVRRRGTRSDPRAQVELVALTSLAVLAATTYGAFVMNGYRPQMAVYYVPFVGLFLGALHLRVLAPSRSAYVLGALWLAFLVAASAGLTLKDARAESATVAGPGGSLAETPAEAGLYSAALAEIAQRTRAGEPILVAPILTGLYTLSDRESPLRELSLLPGALADPAAERAAIARLEQSDVRLVLADTRPWKGYGEGAFGVTFDRALGRWIESNFVRAKTLTTGGPGPRTINLWVRREQ
jgi:hypothetical protein